MIRNFDSVKAKGTWQVYRNKGKLYIINNIAVLVFYMCRHMQHLPALPASAGSV